MGTVTAKGDLHGGSAKRGDGALRLCGVTKFFEPVNRRGDVAGSRVEVLRDVSLEVKRGESVSVVGSSGAGKTTLMMIAAGLERPSEGSVFIAGKDITEADEDALAECRQRYVGIVFQSFHLVPTLTALENVSLPLELRDGDGSVAEVRDRVMGLLEAVGLGARATHRPDQLSGGERQRVSLARALVTRPAVVLADEPTGNLDDDSSRAAMDLLFSLQQSSGAALVLITHDTALAARCGRTTVLNHGVLTEARP